MVVRSRFFLSIVRVVLLMICVSGGVAAPASARNNDSCLLPTQGGAALGDDGEENSPYHAPAGRPRYRGTPPTILFFPSVIPPNVARVAEFFNYAPHAYFGSTSDEQGALNRGQATGRSLSLLDHILVNDATVRNYRVVSLTDSPTDVAALAQQMSIEMGGAPIYIYVVHADPGIFHVSQSLNWIRDFHPELRHRARAVLAIEQLTPTGSSMWVAVGPLSSDQVQEAYVATSNINPAGDFRQQGLQIIRNDHYLEGEFRDMRASRQLLTE